MEKRHFHTITRKIGIVTAITSASFHWIVNIMISAPMIVTVEIKISSGA